MTEEQKTRMWNAIIGLIVAVTTALTVWVNARNTQDRVKKSENLVQETVKEETAAVTEEAAKVAVGVAEKVAEAKVEEVAVPKAIEDRIEALEVHAEEHK